MAMWVTVNVFEENVCGLKKSKKTGLVRRIGLV